MPQAKDLTPTQLLALTITERTTSALSLLGFLFVIGTYLFSTGFQKPVNRLIFYAQWSNLGSTIVGFISRDAVGTGAGGTQSASTHALCQFQAFLFQMFGGVDVYWALCMSLNVYLALFHNWNSRRMRKAEWKYLLGCYVFSLIPSVIYLFLRTEERGRVYGPAILWCWIAPEWSFLRIATMYAIVWVALLGAGGVYVLALRKAWRHRRALKGLLNPLNENPFAGIVTTEIEVVFSDGEDGRAGAENGGSKAGEEGEDRALRSRFDRMGMQELGNQNPYAVNVQGMALNSSSRSRPDLLRLPTLTRKAAMAEENAEAWLYARVAFLYFLAMIICWIPASINRLVALIRPEDTIFGLNYVAIVGLPLQGFLNALVYYVSSQTAVKNVFYRFTRRPSRQMSARSTRDAERLRDSYPPSAKGGTIFQDPSHAPTMDTRSRPHEYSSRFSDKSKTATVSVESFPSSRNENAQAGANIL